MPINIQPSNGLLKPADMGFNLEFRKSGSKQHSSSKTARESSILPHLKRSSKEADKLKLKSNGVGPQCSDCKQKGKLDAEGKVQNRKETESDELVKHMSNLPGYLLRTDRIENVQEKAFNVGVLDWSRLEKWKPKNKHIPVLPSNFASFNSSESSSRTTTKPSTSVGGKEKLNDRKSLPPSGIRPSCRESLAESAKLPFGDVKRFESSKIVTKNIGDEKRMMPKTLSDVSLEKERRHDYSKRTVQVKNFPSNTRLHGISSVPNENAHGRGDVAKQNMEGLQEHNHKKKERNRKASSDMGQPSVKSRRSKGSSSSSKKMSSNYSESGKKVDQLQESDFDVGHKRSCSKPSNIVLLCPQEIPQSSSSDDFPLSESRTSSDENFSESTKSSLSYVSLPEEVYNECSEIPLSGALHSAVEFSSSLKTMQHGISTNLGIDCSSVVSETPASVRNKMSSLQSVSACFEKDMLETKLRDQYLFGNLKESLDQETAELTAQKEMNPSHNRRFSFSLSRIGRSFSFKEGPTLPQVSSTHVIAKSGPVTPQSSVRWDNPSKEKANSHTRTRTSPSSLWRLLDPLLKHKASDKHHSAQSRQTLEGSTDSSFTTNGVNESLLAAKSKGSSPVQGLLQLTIKNGVPFFKFVLNNEKKIFAATRNSLASLEKGDLGSCFTFYLVNEIKKKSGGWISHGSKEKNCGYAYNVIAHMKSSSSKITEPTNQNSNRKCMVKEYVLMGVEIGQTDQGPPKFIQSAELAAVVIETSCEKSNGLHGDNNLLNKWCSKCLADERCLCSSGQNDASDCTTVILPGGVHGSPIKGEPTPLIFRWKTGGSCDCGGWDIGCKMLVLSNQKQNLSIPKSHKPHHDRFQLFVQEGAEQDTPLFTLLPLKDGFYSVEFDSNITHLQAFFISVSILSCQCSFEVVSMHEEILKEPSSLNNSKLQGKAPLKYAPMPPLSPVGRV